MNLIKYSTILAIFLTLGLLFWSLQDPICLNSSIVKKIDIPSAQGRLSLVSCGYRDSDLGSLPEGLQNTYKNLEADISSLEIFKNLMDETYKPNVIIQVSLTRPQMLEWKNNVLALGIDYFENRAEMRRALIQSWLMSFLRPEFIQNKVIFESLSDVFTLMVYGNIRPDIKFTKWLDDIYSEHSLCQSSWNPNDRTFLCEELNSANSDIKKITPTFDEVSSWSLRPLLVKNFWQYYSDLKSSEKINFYREFYSKLRTANITKDIFPDRVDVSSLISAYEKLNKILFDLRAYEIPARKFQVDFYVLFRNKQFNLVQFEDLINYSYNNPQLNVLIRKDDDYFVLPEMKLLRVGYSNLETKKSVIVSCSNPTLNNVMSQKVKNGRVLLVAQCKDNEPLRLSEYLRGNVETFIEGNPLVNFMVFHVPSIKLAKQSWNLNTNSSFVVSRGPEVNNNLKLNLFGWTSATFDTAVKIEAPLPIVEWIRWNGLTKTSVQ